MLFESFFKTLPVVLYFALSIISTNLQDFLLDRGVVDMMRTTSPMLASLFSSCGMYLVVLVINLPYISCFTCRSTATVILLSIRLLTTISVLVLRREVLCASTRFLFS